MNNKAIPYYIKSFFTLLSGVRNFWVLPGLLVSKNSKEDHPVKLRTGDTFSVFNFMDVWILKETVLDRQYEKVGVPLQKVWTVLDIGAALGDYSVWAARQLSQGRLIAVEPFAPSVELLNKNLFQNHISNVEVFCGAISGKTGNTDLKLSDHGIVMNSTSMADGSSSSVQVPAITLEDLFDRFSISHCDYLKIDCEGGEYEIFFGLPSTILARIDRICMEVHDGVTDFNRQDMIRFLGQNGYSTRLSINPVHDNIAYLYAEKIPSKER